MDLGFAYTLFSSLKSKERGGKERKGEEREGKGRKVFLIIRVLESEGKEREGKGKKGKDNYVLKLEGKERKMLFLPFCPLYKKTKKNFLFLFQLFLI